MCMTVCRCQNPSFGFLLDVTAHCPPCSAFKVLSNSSHIPPGLNCIRHLKTRKCLANCERSSQVSSMFIVNLEGKTASYPCIGTLHTDPADPRTILFANDDYSLHIALRKAFRQMQASSHGRPSISPIYRLLQIMLQEPKLFLLLSQNHVC